MNSAAHHVEICVIGAGVIGLAVARALSKIGKEVLILERCKSIGTGTLRYHIISYHIIYSISYSTLILKVW